MFTTKTSVERLVGITFDENSKPTASQLDEIIREASQTVLLDLTVYIYRDKINGYVPNYQKSPVGECNGSNKIFYTKFTPIADKNLDGKVDENDITIEVVNYDSGTVTEVEIETIDSSLGKITLKSAPQSGEDVWATYRAWVVPNVYDALLEELTNYQVASRLLRNPYSDFSRELISSYSLEGVSIQKSTRDVLLQEAMKYEEKYKMLLRKILGGHDVVYL